MALFSKFVYKKHCFRTQCIRFEHKFYDFIDKTRTFGVLPVASTGRPGAACGETSGPRRRAKWPASGTCCCVETNIQNCRKNVEKQIKFKIS